MNHRVNRRALMQRRFTFSYIPLSTAQCVPGTLVRYHPVIGGPHDGRIYEIAQAAQMMSDRPCTWLRRKSGCVAINSLSILRTAEGAAP